MIVLVILANTLLSEEVMKNIVDIMQGDVTETIVTAIPIDALTPFPVPIINYTPEYDDCLTYSNVYPEVNISNAHMPEVVHLAQHKMDSKSRECYFQTKPLCTPKTGEQYGSPSGLKINFNPQILTKMTGRERTNVRIMILLLIISGIISIILNILLWQEHL